MGHIPQKGPGSTGREPRGFGCRVSRPLAHALVGASSTLLYCTHGVRPISFNHAGNDRGVPKLRDGTRDLEPDWDYLKTWQAMESIYANNPDKVKAIGVSNCSTHHLRAIMAIARVVPAVNQVELHPSLPQVELVSYCKENCIQLVAHSPLGSPESKLMTEPTILEIARNHGGTAAQCLISWGLQKGWAVLPKSVCAPLRGLEQGLIPLSDNTRYIQSSRPRIVSNLNTFELSHSDMEAIDELGSLCPRRYVTPAW